MRKMFNANFYKMMQKIMESSGLSSASSVSVKTYNGGTSSAEVTSSQPYNIVWGFGVRVGTGATSTSYFPQMCVLSNNTTNFYDTRSDESNADSKGVILGDGDAEPTSNDYKLSGNIITDFTATTGISVTSGTDGATVTATYDVFNTGTTPFTVKEIGLTKRTVAGSGGTRMLLEHTKLSSPVTINPGESKTIVYAITFK